MNARRLLVLLSLSLSLTACYWNDDIASDQVGIKVDGGRLVECYGPGVYSDGGLYTDLREVPISTLTFEVSDPSVATKDTQIVGLTVVVQVRRKADCDSVKNLLTNWPALMDDATLISTVSATTNEGMKVGTRGMTLETLLNDRNGLSDVITDSLSQDAAKYSVEIINVSIKDVALDPVYEQKLKDKAAITVDIDTAIRNQDLYLAQQEAERVKIMQAQETARTQAEQEALTAQLRAQQLTLTRIQQLEAEEAQTAIDVEIAERLGQQTAAANQVYTDNPQAYELERLRRYENILGDKAVVYFVQDGTELTLLLNQSNQQVIPAE